MSNIKINNNYNFTTMERILTILDEDHSPSTLKKLKDELNKFFVSGKCREVLYTVNTDKQFFGMRVYPMFNGNDAMELLGDSRSKAFTDYYVEFDSKLFDPMLGLEAKELVAMILHEIGHIVLDVGNIEEVRSRVDMYFAKSGDHVDVKMNKAYRELIGYALKDAIMKAGSLFTKFRNEEIMADAFVASCGFGPYLESGMRRLARSSTFLNKDVDDRFIALIWVLRLRVEFNVRRVPMIHTLNKAKQMTGSQLERRELEYAVDVISKMESIEEGVFGNIIDRFSNKYKKFKANGIRIVKDEVYDLNLRIRTASTDSDLRYVIRAANADISILIDYLNDDISDEERKAANDALQDLYDIRQKAAKEVKVRNFGDGVINVIYPE